MSLPKASSIEARIENFENALFERFAAYFKECKKRINEYERIFNDPDTDLNPELEQPAPSEFSLHNTVEIRCCNELWENEFYLSSDDDDLLKEIEELYRFHEKRRDEEMAVDE